MVYPMSGFIDGTCRTQATLFPDRLDDFITEENAIRVIDVFIDSLDISNLGFKTIPADTGRPAYYPPIGIHSHFDVQTPCVRLVPVFPGNIVSLYS